MNCDPIFIFPMMNKKEITNLLNQARKTHYEYGISTIGLLSKQYKILKNYLKAKEHNNSFKYQDITFYNLENE